jgi:hypothetical protein
VRHAVDELQVRMSRSLLEAEEADNPVDVDRQQRSVQLYQR